MSTEVAPAPQAQGYDAVRPVVLSALVAGAAVAVLSLATMPWLHWTYAGEAHEDWIPLVPADHPPRSVLLWVLVVAGVLAALGTLSTRAAVATTCRVAAPAIITLTLLVGLAMVGVTLRAASDTFLDADDIITPTASVAPGMVVTLGSLVVVAVAAALGPRRRS